MNFDKRALIGAAGVLVFAVVLGISSVTMDDSEFVKNSTYGIVSAAGANAAYGNGNQTSAGANGEVGVVGSNGVVVGQGYDLTYGYTNLGLCNVEEGNLNVRKEAKAGSSVVGKMTRYAACEILGEENGFYQIKSGNVEGYVSAEFIITGDAAWEIAHEEAKLMATVNTEALRVRQEATTESIALALVNQDDDFVVLEQLEGWIKIEVDDYEGYISADYAVVDMKLKTGNTMKELSYGNGISSTRVDLVNFALQFVGNRYVWGGESLTNGVDCSGFTMKVYQKFGVYMPHHSGSQPGYGTKISKDQIRPGDLIFYGNGSRINHVAIYIGNGQVVHASNARDGIKISNAFYRAPVCIVSYLP